MRIINLLNIFIQAGIPPLRGAGGVFLNYNQNINGQKQTNTIQKRPEIQSQGIAKRQHTFRNSFMGGNKK